MGSRIVAFGVAVALSSLGAACSSDEPTAPTTSETGSPEPDGEDGVTASAYVSAVCGGLVDWLGEVQTLTQAFGEASSQAANLQQIKGAAVDYFDGLIDSTDALISDIEDSGAPDVPRGEEAAQRVIDGLSEARTAMQDAREQIEDLATDDPQVFVARLQEITSEMGRQMSQVGTSMEEFQSDELDAAADDVTACSDVAA